MATGGKFEGGEDGCASAEHRMSIITSGIYYNKLCDCERSKSNENIKIVRTLAARASWMGKKTGLHKNKNSAIIRIKSGGK